MYMDAVKQKKLPNPGTASYDTIEAAQADPLIIAKLQFFLAISRTFSPFLTNYQTDEPVLPFLAKDLSELLKSLLQRFIKGELLQDATPLKLTKIDVAHETNRVSYRNVDIGMGDVIVQQFQSFLSLEARDERFLSFQPLKERLDVFLHSALSKSYPELSKFSQSLLLLSHGQATVERGFSINKEVETCNILEKSVEALRLICDKVCVCGGVLKVPLTKELMASVASARSQYRIYLEDERKKKQSATQGLKRKAVQEEMEDLKTKRLVLTEVCHSLQRDADQLAEQAEGKSGSLMAQLITKSNSLRRRCKEKQNELAQTETLLDSKSNMLRHMS
ncbi:hypothetical protein AAFF_G00136280 [Aldrovandia affinis]|uniref:Uncharacterized protein n=1 Tax=Aldrovandia affinis TaxID=143900 RepID=A0AAD7RQA1_9TELE|nr:hypothetical protein AAFF_G00136280 [Aldrovandia affinis]